MRPSLYTVGLPTQLPPKIARDTVRPTTSYAVATAFSICLLECIYAVRSITGVRMHLPYRVNSPASAASTLDNWPRSSQGIMRPARPTKPLWTKTGKHSHSTRNILLFRASHYHSHGYVHSLFLCAASSTTFPSFQSPTRPVPHSHHSRCPVL